MLRRSSHVVRDDARFGPVPQLSHHALAVLFGAGWGRAVGTAGVREIRFVGQCRTAFVRDFGVRIE